MVPNSRCTEEYIVKDKDWLKIYWYQAIYVPNSRLNILMDMDVLKGRGVSLKNTNVDAIKWLFQVLATHMWQNCKLPSWNFQPSSTSSSREAEKPIFFSILNSLKTSWRQKRDKKGWTTVVFLFPFPLLPARDREVMTGAVAVIFWPWGIVKGPTGTPPLTTFFQMRSSLTWCT